MGVLSSVLCSRHADRQKHAKLWSHASDSVRAISIVDGERVGASGKEKPSVATPTSTTRKMVQKRTERTQVKSTTSQFGQAKTTFGLNHPLKTEQLRRWSGSLQRPTTQKIATSILHSEHAPIVSDHNNYRNVGRS